MNDSSVEKLDLPKRISDSLQKNGISTLEQLSLLDKEDLRQYSKLDEESVNKVLETVYKYKSIKPKENDKMILDDFRNEDEIDDGMSISDYLSSVTVHGRNLVLFATYYNNLPDVTLEKLGDEYDITRERVRQILEKIKNKLKKAISSGVINKKIMGKIRSAAEKKTEINMISIKDELLTSEGVVRLVASLFNKEFEILNSPKMHGYWLVMREENVGGMINEIVNMLNERDTPIKIIDLKMIFPINDDMLMSIKRIVEKDGYVTLLTNKVASCTGRVQRVVQMLETINRPATTREIAERLNMTDNQVRGTVCLKEYFVNVGQSLYDLVDRDYTGISSRELARNYLIAMGKAVKLDVLVRYIKKYNNGTTASIISELLSSDDFYKVDNLILLKEWSEDKIEKWGTKEYAIQLEDAIMGIFNETDEIMNAEMMANRIKEKFGDKASSNINSVKMTLSSLYQNEKITKAGSLRSGCYMRMANKKID